MSCLMVTHRWKAVCTPSSSIIRWVSFWNHYKHFEFLTTMKAGNLSFNNFLSQYWPVLAVVVFSFQLVKGNPWNKGIQSLHLLKLCIICGLYSNVGFSVSLAPSSPVVACNKFPQDFSSVVAVLLSWLTQIRQAFSPLKVPWIQWRHR